MRVGVDIRCLQDTWRTGVGEYTFKVAQELSRLSKLELMAYANAAGGPKLGADVKALFRTIYTGTYPNRLRNLMFSLGWGKALDEELARNAQLPDVMWLPVPLFARFSGNVPVVMTVHDLSFLYYPSFFKRRGRLWYFPSVRRLLTSGLPQQTRLVAVSKHTAADVAERFPRLAAHITVIPPGVGDEFRVMPSTADMQTVQTSYHLPKKYLLSLGTIEPRKNYVMLLKAYANVVRHRPDYPCDLVIAGAWGWRTGSFKRVLANMDCRERVHVLGYIPPADKPALYAGATIFLYPSYYEGYGMPVLEAMSLGRPVIASLSSALPEVVGSAGLLLDPKLASSWSEAIDWLSRDEAARQKLGQAARQAVSHRTWQASARLYQQVFADLLP